MDFKMLQNKERKVNKQKKIVESSSRLWYYEQGFEENVTNILQKNEVFVRKRQENDGNLDS